MSLATVAVTSGVGRGSLPYTVAVIPVTVTLAATAYATASGGVAFDLTPVLLQAGAWGAGQVNPGDILDAIGYSEGTVGKFLITDFAVGTATYTAQPYAGTYEPGVGTLATCPCTARLFGTGAADNAHFDEIADGNLTGTLHINLLVARGGHN